MTLLVLTVLIGCQGKDSGGDSSPPTDSEPGTDDSGPTHSTDPDGDDDGVPADEDCDDADPAVYPGAVEVCDGKDSDCKGGPHPDEADVDKDGQPDCAVCDAEGFWLSVRGLEGKALESAVGEVVDGHDCDDYSETVDYMFITLDNAGGEVECVYTGRTTEVEDKRPDNEDMNTEHSWPQSQGAESLPAKCDLHHLYPTDSLTNNYRANLPFGEVVEDTRAIDGDSRLGLDDNDDEVFEPRDQHKGNVARSMLYFSLQYGYPLGNADLSMYQDWASQDPVDEAELQRSQAIADRQGRANPFVVCPGLSDRL